MTEFEKLRQDVHQDLMNDGTEYCCYCGQARYTFGCCGEVHYETYAEMRHEDQQNLLDEMVADELLMMAQKAKEMK